MSDGRRVLVVDDDPIIQGFLLDALSDEGYEVRTAPNGRDALAVADGWRPDLIVLDLMMPVMDGRTFRARQREHAKLCDVPVVILSATRDISAQSEGLDPAGVFSKPFDLETLLDAVDRLTGPASADREV
jgi:two-component system OmpR family response regulator